MSFPILSLEPSTSVGLMVIWADAWKRRERERGGWRIPHSCRNFPAAPRKSGPSEKTIFNWQLHLGFSGLLLRKLVLLSTLPRLFPLVSQAVPTGMSPLCDLHALRAWRLGPLFLAQPQVGHSYQALSCFGFGQWENMLRNLKWLNKF